MTSSPVWWNGRLVEEAAAPISIRNQGWLWGRGVFETLAVKNRIPLALSRHLERLQTGADRLHIELPDEKVLRSAVQAIADLLSPELHRMRITLTGGESPGLSLGSGPGNLLVRAQRVDPPGTVPAATLVTAPFRRNEFSPLAGIKSTSYAENAVILDWAAQRGASEALLLNTAGDLCEGAISNVFLVESGRVLTPSLHSGCLPGITRALVLELCAHLGLEHLEKSLTPADLAQASELFLTSSIRGIQPVESCDSRNFEAPGAVTARLAAALADLEERLPDP